MNPSTEMLVARATHVLEQTPPLLRGLLAAAEDDVLNWKPFPERWSIREVLAHLVDVEQAGFRSRMEAMLRASNPLLPSYDQTGVIASGKYAGIELPELLSRFERERSESLRFLRQLPPGCEDRSGKHAELGPITIGVLLHEWPFHDLGHIRQIAELYRSRLFYPHMGAFCRYYSVHP
jgi:hypothetical protein